MTNNIGRIITYSKNGKIVLLISYRNKVLDTRGHIVLSTSIEDLLSLEEGQIGTLPYPMKGDIRFNSFSRYDMSKLLDFQNILLKAYVKSLDKFENLDETDSSIVSLESCKNRIHIIRVHLRNITRYIDNYNVVKEEIIKDL